MPIEGPTFYVVGNGPSLSTKILDALPRGSWLGMNAAYKYWDKTGRYPHFYACLDPVVVVQHKDAIARLIQEDAIAELFLHEAIFEVMPDLRHHPKVTARDAFLAASQTLPVSAMSKYKQTTGVLATRFCIERGFHNLCLLGIDCNYVEKLTEAETGQGYELIIKDDVGRNPNYFFDGYQEKNEKYQVPNPEVHSGNLHLQSFIALQNDIAISKLPIHVSVGSRNSLLSRFNIFPLCDVYAGLSLRRLGAVVVPMMLNEIDGFLDRLSFWIDPKLQPSFHKVGGVALHIFLAGKGDVETEQKIKDAIERLPWISQYFAETRITFLDIAPEVDYYVRGTSLNVFCNKSGPNVFWLMIMASCRNYEYTFLMEADCVPVRPGWVDALEGAIKDSSAGTWVVGANYHGPTMAAPVNVFHINGNAIYATGDRDFQDYLDGPFVTALQSLAENTSNSVAYDVAYSLGMHNYQELLKRTNIDLRKYAWRYSFTPVLRNISGQVETENLDKINIMNEVRRDVAMYICHGQPALRWLNAEFDALDSYYCENHSSIKEARIHSVGSLSKFVTWKNLGYGKAAATLHSNQKEWPGEIKINIGAMVGVGSEDYLELHFNLTPSLSFRGVDAFGFLADKTKVKILTDLLARNERSVIRVSTDVFVTEVSLQLTFEVRNRLADSIVGLGGFRLLHYPSVSIDDYVKVLPKCASAQSVEAAWSNWIRKGQANISARYRFIECVAPTKMPTLKELSSSPAAIFENGVMIISISDSTKARLRFGTKLLASSEPDVKISVQVTANVDCKLLLGAKAFGYAIVEERRDLSAFESIIIPINFRLSPSHGSDFFLFFDVAPISGPTSTEAPNLVVEKILILKTPQFPEPKMESAKPRRLISVNPDAESFFGHFLNYEARLGKALRETGQQHIIAGPIDAEPQVYEAHPEMAKVFSGRTNTLYSKTPGAAVPGLDVFEAELDRYLATLDHSTPSQLFMYCGSLEIAEVFGRLAQRYPSCQFAISLYYLSWLNLSDKAMQAYWAPRLAALSAHPQIRLIVPSPELAAEMRAGFGVETEILPHPTTTFHDQEIGTLQGGNSGDDRITVVFPGNLRGGKGFDLTKDALLALIDQGVDNLRLRVRFPPDDSVNNARRAFFDQIRGKVEIMDSYLDEEAFRELLLSADLVALPYTPDRFSNRTSGLLIDSLLLGVPSVVIDRTWLAGKVRELGFGVVVEESGKALATGIRSAVAEIASLKKAALRARDLYVQENSWSALVSFLNAPGQHLATVSSKALLPADVADTDRVQQSEDTSVPRRMLIIGNGPSARLLAEAGFDKIPADMDTWGTTAAYRYFERVGWWPTYYALADRKVVFHHRDNFARLLDDPKVTSKKFYLSWKVSDSEKLELIPHSSTGSFSLKKAVELGYKEIYLIGMEGAYVEEILESRSLSPEEIEARGFGVLNLSRAESKLRIIDRIPTFNPNYFFSGYQIEGDVYSLPQAHTHQANWDGVKDVVAAAGARVINLSKISKIDAFERGDIRSVFPFLPESCWNDVSDPFTEKAQHAKSVSSMLARGFTEKTPGVWSLSPGNLQKAGLRATFNNPGMTEGRRLVAGLTLTASIDLKLTLTFGREGTTDYEGIGRIVSLKAGKPTNLHLVHHYRNRHKALKLQIADVDLMGHENLNLQIDSIFLTESVDSIVARHDADELTDRRASIAFDEGNDSFALGIWLYLREASQDARFDSNIAKVAARIGIPKPYTSSSLGARLICAALPTDKVAPVSQPSTPQVRPVPAIAAPKETAANGHIAARSVLIMAASKLLLGAVGDGLSRQAGPTAQQIADAIDLLPKTDETALHYLKVRKFAEENAAGKALNREKH